MTISAPLNISATTMIKGKPVEIKSNPGKMRSAIGPRMDMAFTR